MFRTDPTAQGSTSTFGCPQPPYTKLEFKQRTGVPSSEGRSKSVQLILWIPL